MRLGVRWRRLWCQLKCRTLLPTGPRHGTQVNDKRHQYVLNILRLCMTLKLLDARGNGIQLSLAQELIAALEGSSIRELLLAGNCIPFGSQMPHLQRSGQIITFRPTITFKACNNFQAYWFFPFAR